MASVRDGIDDDQTVARNAPTKHSDEKSALQNDQDANELSPKQTTISERLSLQDSPTDPEKGQASVTETQAEPQDPNIVDWDGPDDPANPQNWSPALKWSNIAILSAITFLVPLGSSFFAPAVPALLKEFGEHNETLATFVVSVYVLGFAVGPLIVAPLSEIYGRLPIYHISILGFICFSVGAALSTNMTMLIIFRLLQGSFGASPLSNGGGTIADLMPPEKRGSAMALWACGPLLGPVIAPVAGGFLSDAAGWRWIFWVLVIATGVVESVGLIFFRETYAPILLERKTKRLQKETGNMNLRSKYHEGHSAWTLFTLAIVRPSKMLFLSPICSLMSIYMAIIYGILYILFTTFTFVFEDTYGFSQSTVGLTYIAMGIGMLGGLAVLGFTSDRIMKHLARKYSDGKVQPEYRLPPIMYVSPLIPAGLFIYGWTAQYHTHWIVPLFGTLLVGVGLIAAYMSIGTYIVDTYGRYAASAMAANTILRSILGAVFPLFALQMYDAIGLGWGNSVLAFVSLAMCPIPFLFYTYGERLRTNPRFQIKF